ncbi:MAG: histidinol-phosphatase [Lentisphaeria bacterium]|nr:histidinol-phosphatase [Lentisphaeria bacterium]
MKDLRKLFSYPGPGTGVSLHNHSTWSDGASTAEEMCRAAKAAKIRVFGLSDHWVVHPDRKLMPVPWSVAPDRLDAYFGELARLKKLFEDDSFTLLAGLEADFFFENFREVLSALEKYPLDYLVGSVHYAGTFPVDNSPAEWEGLTEEAISSICREYWEKLLGAAECGAFSFLGHLDLPKKFGFVRDPEAYLPAARRVLDAAAATGTPVELNTAGWFKECREPYPSPAILREACLRRVPVVISADAHASSHVNRNFPEAQALLRQAGYPC